MRPGILFGLISGGANALWVLVGFRYGISSKPGLAWVGFAPLIFLFVMVFLAQWRQKYTVRNGVLGFREGFKEGMLTAALTSVLIGFAVWLSLSVMDPGFVERLVAQSEVFFRKQGKSITEIMRNSQALRENYVNSQLAGNIFFTLFSGTMFSMLIAAFLRTVEPKKV